MKQLKRFIVPFLLLIATSALFQNCSNQNFAIESTAEKLGEGDEVMPSTIPEDGSVGVPAQATPTPKPTPEEVVCDPFSQESGNFGVKARLFAYTGSDASSKITKVADMFSKGTEIKGLSIYFHRIYVPTRKFSSGFETPDGALLKDSKGTALVEYFGLEYESQLKLRPDEAEGLYQLGMISDDGSILEAKLGANYEVMVDNDGNHSPRMICGATVQMARSTKLNIRLRYHQGPKELIANALVWRKVQPGAALQPSAYCGQSKDFFVDGAPAAAFTPMHNDGWKFPDAANYVSTAAKNACQK